MTNSVRKVENIHIFLWLLKDSCWVMDFQRLGVFMIVPTITVALYITIKTRKITTELFHNIAVCCWVMANSVWMIGEFFYDDTTRPYATVFFVLGVVVMAYYYLIFMPLSGRKQKFTTQDLPGSEAQSFAVSSSAEDQSAVLNQPEIYK